MYAYCEHRSDKIVAKNPPSGKWKVKRIQCKLCEFETLLTSIRCLVLRRSKYSVSKHSIHFSTSTWYLGVHLAYYYLLQQNSLHYTTCGAWSIDIRTLGCAYVYSMWWGEEGCLPAFYKFVSLFNSSSASAAVFLLIVLQLRWVWLYYLYLHQLHVQTHRFCVWTHSSCPYLLSMV